ncbi:MAG: hypothetical protein ACLTQI_04260 [Slackia sp.]
MMVVGVMVERMKVENDADVPRSSGVHEGEAMRPLDPFEPRYRPSGENKKAGEKPLWQAIVRGLGIGIAAVVLGATVGYASAMLLDMPLSF